MSLPHMPVVSFSHRTRALQMDRSSLLHQLVLPSSMRPSLFSGD
jgi:hypothetical protein